MQHTAVRKVCSTFNKQELLTEQEEWFGRLCTLVTLYNIPPMYYCILCLTLSFLIVVIQYASSL